MNEYNRRQKMIVFTGILFAMFLSSLDSTIVSTAMPKVTASLSGVEYLSWVFTAYMLASTISVPIFGKLSDIYGRKYFYIIGIIIFLIGSVLSGTSKNIMQLIIYRAFQGVGGGIMASNSMAITSDIFTPAERGKYQGIISSIFGIASIIGPALGGFITDYMSWRWIFYINLPVGIISLLILWFGVPSFKREGEKQKIDYFGTAFIIAAFTPMLLAFSWGGSKYAWSSKEIIGLLIFSIISLIILVLIELKVKNPIIPIGYFKNSIFTVGVLSSFCMAVAMFGTITYIPIFVQGVVGTTATQSGAIITPMLLSLVVTSTIAGQLISKYGKYKVLSMVGFAIMFVGMVLFCFTGVRTTNVAIVFDMIVFGCGLGITMPVFIIAIQNAFPQTEVGTVTASMQFFRNIGSTAGVAILGTILNSEFKTKSILMMPESLKKVIPKNIQSIFYTPQTLFDPNLINTLKSRIYKGELPVFNKFLIDLKGILSSASHNVFLAITVVVAIGFILLFFLKELPLRKTRKCYIEKKNLECEL